MSVQLRSRLLAIGMLAAAGLSLVFGVADLKAVLDAISRRDAVVAFWPPSAAEPALAVVFLLFAIALFIPPRPEDFGPSVRTARGRGRGPGPGTLCVMAAIACTPAVIVAPPVATFVMGARLASLGYARCAAIFEGVRKLRWAAPATGRCPRSP